MEKEKWIDIAIAWINNNNDGTQTITVKHCVPVTEGTNLYLRPNTYKRDNPKAPDYKYSVPESRYVNGEVLAKDAPRGEIL